MLFSSCLESSHSRVTVATFGSIAYSRTTAFQSHLLHFRAVGLRPEVRDGHDRRSCALKDPISGVLINERRMDGRRWKGGGRY